MLKVVFRVAREFDVIEVKLTELVQKKLAAFAKEHKCLACERPIEKTERLICGCCVSCDQTQRYAMRKGKVTLEELLESGERAVKATSGRKPASDYAAKLLGRSKS
jgi:hypothetical protein